MECAVVEYDIGWESLFASQAQAELFEAFEHLSVCDSTLYFFRIEEREGIFFLLARCLFFFLLFLKIFVLNLGEFDGATAKEDIALVVDESVTAAQVEALIRATAKDLAEEVRLFDVFRGEQLGEGRKSLAFSLRLRAADRTLTAEDTAGIRKRIVKRAAKALGAELRA